jgi:hypothetical protein
VSELVQRPRAALLARGGLLEDLRGPPVRQPRLPARRVDVAGRQRDPGTPVGEEHRAGLAALQQPGKVVPQVVGGALDELEMAMAGVIVRGLIAVTGGEDDIRAAERRRIEASEQDRRLHAPRFSRNADGMTSAAWPIAPESSAPVPGGQVTPAPQMSPRMADGIPGMGMAPSMPGVAGQAVTKAGYAPDGYYQAYMRPPFWTGG